jgi:hypothetical protein
LRLLNLFLVVMLLTRVVDTWIIRRVIFIDSMFIQRGGFHLFWKAESNLEVFDFILHRQFYDETGKMVKEKFIRDSIPCSDSFKLVKCRK